MLSLTIRARSARAEVHAARQRRVDRDVALRPRDRQRLGIRACLLRALRASSTAALSAASLKSRVVAVADLVPTRTVTVSLRSYCTRLVVIDELAQRVPDRSPPVRSTSTASALAMLKILSVMVLTSSREYIGWKKTSTGGWRLRREKAVRRICWCRAVVERSRPFNRRRLQPERGAKSLRYASGEPRAEMRTCKRCSHYRA